MSTERKPEIEGKRTRPFRLRFHGWVRWIHTYTSLLTLLLVLFFSVTGITLNHPEWVFGTAESKHSYSGKLDSEWLNGEDLDWLMISESLRKSHGIHGEVTDKSATDIDGSLTYKGPGYSADVFFDRASGEYEIEEIAYGPVAVLNDLHKGRDSGVAWKWVIDISAGFLVLISLTGLIMLFYLKKIKVKGLLTVLAGSVASVWLMWWVANR